MKTARFSRVACWPTNSARVCGRRLASAASSSRRTGEIRCGGSVAHPGAFLRQLLQAVTDHRIERRRVAQPLDRARDHRLRLRPAVAEIDQRRNRVLGHAGRGALRHGEARRRRHRSALSRSSVSSRTASRAPTPGARVRLARSPAAMADDQIARRQRRQHGQRDPPADALHRGQQAEPVALGRVGKAVEQDRVLAHMRLHQQPRDVRRRGQRGERAGGGVHQIADAVHVDDAAALLQRLDAAGELGDHARRSFISYAR